MTVALDIYAGPLRKVVKQYTGRGDIDLVMIAARGKSWIGKAFPELSPLSQLLVRKQIFFNAPVASGHSRARTMKRGARFLYPLTNQALPDLATTA